MENQDSTFGDCQGGKREQIRLKGTEEGRGLNSMMGVGLEGSEAAEVCPWSLSW